MIRLINLKTRLSTYEKIEDEKLIEKKERVDTPIKIASEKYNLLKNSEDIDTTETGKY